MALKRNLDRGIPNINSMYDLKTGNSVFFSACTVIWLLWLRWLRRNFTNSGKMMDTFHVKGLYKKKCFHTCESNSCFGTQKANPGLELATQERSAGSRSQTARAGVQVCHLKLCMWILLNALLVSRRLNICICSLSAGCHLWVKTTRSNGPSSNWKTKSLSSDNSRATKTRRTFGRTSNTSGGFHPYSAEVKQSLTETDYHLFGLKTSPSRRTFILQKI